MQPKKGRLSHNLNEQILVSHIFNSKFGFAPKGGGLYLYFCTNIDIFFVKDYTLEMQ